MGEKEINNVKGWLGVATQFISILGWIVAIISSGGVVPAIPAVIAGVMVGGGGQLLGTRLQATSKPLSKEKEVKGYKYSGS